MVVAEGPADEGNASAPELPGFVVVLSDGSSLPVLTEPVIAFGKVRFQDVDGRTRSLSASRVDLDATRAVNGRVSPGRRVGTVSFGSEPQRGAGSSPSASTPASPDASSKVSVYSATWCPHCRTLEAFLDREHIRATVIMVDQMPAAEQQRLHAEMQRLTGRVAYPTVVIGGVARAGFDPEWILSSLGR